MSTKAVTRNKAKKAGGKRSATTAANGPKDLSATHEKVKHVIAEHVEKMTAAIAAEAEKGNLPPFKYLCERLGIYPAPVVEHAESEDSNDLARVLLNRFDFPFKGPADEERDGAMKDEGAQDAKVVPAGAQEESVD